MESLDISTIINQIIDNVCKSASSKNESNLEDEKGFDEKTIIQQTESKDAEVLECDDKIVKEVCDKDKIELSSSELNQSIEVEKELKQTESHSDQSAESVQGLRVIDEDIIKEVSGSDPIQFTSQEKSQHTEADEGLKNEYVVQSNCDRKSQPREAVEGLKEFDVKVINEGNANDPIDSKSIGDNQSCEVVEELKETNDIIATDPIDSEAAGINQPTVAVEELKQSTSHSDEVNQFIEAVQRLKAIDEDVEDESSDIQSNSDEENQQTEADEGLKEFDVKVINEGNANDPIDSKSVGDDQSSEVVEELKDTEAFSANKTNDIIATDPIDSGSAGINQSTVAVEESKQSTSHSDEVNQSIEAVEKIKVIDEDIEDESSDIRSNSDEENQQTEADEGLKDVDGKTINEASTNDPIDTKSSVIKRLTEAVEVLKQEDDQSTETVELLEVIDDEIINEVDQGTFKEKKKQKNRSPKSKGKKSKSTSKELEVQYISSEILRSKGYSINLYGKTRAVGNLTLTGGQYTDCEITCERLPFEMIENELIPLFETAGQIYKMRIIENIGKTYVTYTTPEDAVNAVKILHRRQFRGRQLFVQRHFPNVRLFIKPIPYRVSKQQIFDEIQRQVFGLLKIILFDALEEPGKNRGFCYAEFDNYQSASTAKRILANQKIFGQTVFCDWPAREMIINSLEMFIHNVRPSIHAKDLRKIFSVYGEVSEIDKNGSFASILFRNADDAKRAASEVDKTLLGNENVEISFIKFKYLKSTHKDYYQTNNKTERDSREVAAPRIPDKNGMAFALRPDVFSSQRGIMTASHTRKNVTPLSSFRKAD